MSDDELPNTFISDLMSLFLGTMVPGYKIAKDTVGSIEVSTILTTDLGVYETAVIHESIGVQPVERYVTEEEAVVGHGKWLAEVQGGRTTFTSIGYPGLVDPYDVQIELIPDNG